MWGLPRDGGINAVLSAVFISNTSVFRHSDLAA